MSLSSVCARTFAIVMIVFSTAIISSTAAQSSDKQESDSKPAVAEQTKTADSKKVASKAQLHEAFRKRMTGSKLVGLFTMKGDDSGKQRTEEYHILSANKLDQGNLWAIAARIKYGGKDQTHLITVEVKFAGDTPVITVDKVKIPGMGTFDARVLISGDQYAGTWAHDSVGGHMFGKLERLKPEEMKKRRRKKVDNDEK